MESLSFHVVLRIQSKQVKLFKKRKEKDQPVYVKVCMRFLIDDLARIDNQAAAAAGRLFDCQQRHHIKASVF